MCGIFGFFTSSGTDYRPNFVRHSLKTLALLSESRGIDSAGLVIWNQADRTMTVLKGAVSISYLLKQRDVTQPLDLAIDEAFASSNGHRGAFAVMGH